MAQTPIAPLAGWVNFYVIVGSSAGALTGLQFVVMTLISDTRSTGSMREIRAFGTPTVIHFCAALLVSAMLSAPWHAVSTLGSCVAVCGAAGIAYVLRVISHARKTEYKPDAEDWFWYTAMPLLAYAALLTGGVLLWSRPEISLAIVAVTSLLFLFIGIHNSWDTVTYVAIQHRKKADEGKAVAGATPPPVS